MGKFAAFRVITPINFQGGRGVGGMIEMHNIYTTVQITPFISIIIPFTNKSCLYIFRSSRLHINKILFTGAYRGAYTPEQIKF